MTTHKELVARSVRWLRTEHRCKLIFAEMVTAASTTPDAIGWSHDGFSRLVEVKISRSDFFSDRKKLASLAPDWAMGRRRWYFTPEGLVRPEEVPEGWGLAYAAGKKVKIALEAPERVLGSFAQAEETLLLLSAIRRLSLGSGFNEKTGRWERLEDRLTRQATPP